MSDRASIALAEAWLEAQEYCAGGTVGEPEPDVETYISYVILVYDASILAYKFTTLVLNLVQVLGFNLSTTLVI